MTVRIICSDARKAIAQLSDRSVHACVTSPPYFRLRSYLPPGHPDKDCEIGLQSSPDAYIAEIVDLFREIRRVLRDDGSLWINIGDCYAGSHHDWLNHFAVMPPEVAAVCILAGVPQGGTVLDPFAGAGTTGLVADRLQRDAILIELNADYAEMAAKRIGASHPMLTSVEIEAVPA